ncbi:hypothetical protein OQA88_5567 [Cercophora sp. LCS_1]
MSSLASSASKRDAKSGVVSSESLLDKLAAVLPQGYKFGVHHLSTPPTKTEALCSAPPGERENKTYRENHFLAVSIDSSSEVAASSKRASPGAEDTKEPRPPKPVLVFAIEVFIFTTAYQTIFFISKADSTGYLQLLNLPKSTPSPVREVASTFLAYLLEHRRRKNAQCVVNLFARSQAQYLFPLSVENKGKHVLDDWGLVRWWCRVLNPLLESRKGAPWGSTKGYLIVPGLEEKEMRALTPRTPASTANWEIGHPMERISHYTAEFDWVPIRCLIPRYPDDPKSRFRDELNEEAAKWQQDMGGWKSVKTLDQFWEMMGYRQECSSGRLTGFIWLVFDPEVRPGTPSPPSASRLATPAVSFDGAPPGGPPATPPRRRVDISGHTPQSSPRKLALLNTPSALTVLKEEEPAKKKKKVLKGRIIPREPKVKTRQRNYLADRRTTTAYYHWPLESRGEMIVDESDYKRIVELLLHLDFSTLEKATGSTRRWVSEAAVGTKWGQEVVGRRVPPLNLFGSNGSQGGGVTDLSGLIRKKSPQGSTRSATTNGIATGPTKSDGVNILGAGLIRKRTKTDASIDSTETPSEIGITARSLGDTPKVNVLSSGLVRKKPKTS